MDGCCSPCSMITCACTHSKTLQGGVGCTTLSINCSCGSRTSLQGAMRSSSQKLSSSVSLTLRPSKQHDCRSGWRYHVVMYMTLPSSSHSMRSAILSAVSRLRCWSKGKILRSGYTRRKGGGRLASPCHGTPWSCVTSFLRWLVGDALWSSLWSWNIAIARGHPPGSPSSISMKSRAMPIAISVSKEVSRGGGTWMRM